MNNQQLHTFITYNYKKRKLTNYLFCFLLGLCAFIALFTLLNVFSYVVLKGMSSLTLSFFTELPKPPGTPNSGLANSILGSITLVVLASMIGIFFGISTGIYLSEYGRGKTATIIRFATDMLSSVPSIVIALFVYVILVVPLKSFSAFAGSTALAIIMIPIVARTTEELLKLVPTHIREAGLALGLPRWKVILRIVLRGSLGGIATGVILAIARISGESAPLLFTAFNSRFWQTSLAEPISSLPVQIYNYAISPYEDLHKLAWTSSLVLVIFVFIINLITRLILKPQGRE
jgi:phosphate transport system permease protein